MLVHLPGTPAPSLSLLLDAIVQEVDIATGLVVWEWHGLGHIPLDESYATPANSAYYDAFHINSIQPQADGTTVISARNTSEIYNVSATDGSINWTVGGKFPSFKMGPSTSFYFQHDARLHDCLLYTSPSPRDTERSRMPSSA